MTIHWDAKHRPNLDCPWPEREHRFIQLRSMEICGAEAEVVVRLVSTREQIGAACDLINDRYGWRGYGSSHQIATSAHHMTFTAEIDGEVVGTITLAVDSPRGLAVDTTFKDAIDEFRAASESKVCELTKFAFSPNVQSKKLMAALFHIVFVYGHRTYGCTDLFIEVNPRHVRFYEAMLGFEAIGDLKQNESVAAPAQLMRLEVAAIRRYIDRFATGGAPANARSLYPFFFSPVEENGIYRRLAEADVETGPAERDVIRPPWGSRQGDGVALDMLPAGRSERLDRAWTMQ